VIKKKLSEAKDRIKKHAPEIVCATLAVTSTMYAIIMNHKLAEERRRFPEGGTTRLGVNQCCFDELKSGEPVIWEIKGHKIDIAYDPDC
jgi:hypothetical protein